MTEEKNPTPAGGSEDEIQAVIDRILAADDRRRLGLATGAELRSMNQLSLDRDEE